MAKFKIEELKKEFNNKGWELISDEYINLKTDLLVKCPEGHDCYVSYEKFRKDFECPICKKNQYYKPTNISVKKNGYRILAFDQATITSGWAVFDDEKLIKYGHQTVDGINNTEKIAKTKYWMAAMIEKWKPDQVTFEDIQLQTFDGGEQVVTYKKLAHLQGVLFNYCYELKIPFSVVPPATWRTHSEIKGKTRSDKKKNAQLKVKRFYDVSVSQDEADAILLARYAAYNHSLTKVIEF